MQISYIIVIIVIAYVFGAITKAFVKEVPNHLIPLQNVIVGLVSALICYVFKIETNLLQAIFLCLLATMGAGGFSDLAQLLTRNFLLFSFNSCMIY